jgi:hypothetical protein
MSSRARGLDVVWPTRGTIAKAVADSQVKDQSRRKRAAFSCSHLRLV